MLVDRQYYRWKEIQNNGKIWKDTKRRCINKDKRQETTNNK